MKPYKRIMKRTKFNGVISNRQKYVSIDNKTTIVVPVDTPDEEARANYLKKIQNGKPVGRNTGIEEFVRDINFFR